MIRKILFISALCAISVSGNYRKGPHPPSNDIIYYPDNFEPEIRYIRGPPGKPGPPGKAGNRGTAGGDGPAGPAGSSSCQYVCPSGYFSTSRNYGGKENVWCITMKATSTKFTSNLFGNLDIQCKKDRSVLTGFQNYTEFDAAYNQFKSGFSWISTEQPIIIIGSRRQDQCKSVTTSCSKTNGNQWTDGVTTGSKFFEATGFFGSNQPNPENGKKMCFGVWTKNNKLYSYKCSDSDWRPAKLFMCGKPAPCVF